MADRQLPVSRNKELKPEFTWPDHAAEFDNDLPRIEFVAEGSVITDATAAQLSDLIHQNQGRPEFANLEDASKTLQAYGANKFTQLVYKRVFNATETEARKRREVARRVNENSNRVNNIELVIGHIAPNALGGANFANRSLRTMEAKLSNSRAGEGNLVPVPFSNPFGLPTAEQADELRNFDTIFSLPEESVNRYARLYDCLVENDTLDTKRANIFLALGGSTWKVQEKKISRARERNSRAVDGNLVPVPFSNPFGLPTREQAHELRSYDTIFRLSEESVNRYARLYDCLVEGDILDTKKRELFEAIGGSSDEVVRRKGEQGKAYNWGVVLASGNEALKPVPNTENVFPEGEMATHLESTQTLRGLGAENLNEIIDFYSLKPVGTTNRSKLLAIYNCLGCSTFLMYGER